MAADDDEDCVEHVWRFDGAALVADGHTSLMQHTCTGCGALELMQPWTRALHETSCTGGDGRFDSGGTHCGRLRVADRRRQVGVPNSPRGRGDRVGHLLRLLQPDLVPAGQDDSATGLTNGGTYFFTITSIDTSGNESDEASAVFAKPSAPIPTAWTSLSAGEAQTCGIGTEGTGWCWGDNGSGRLGTGDWTDMEAGLDAAHQQRLASNRQARQDRA